MWYTNLCICMQMFVEGQEQEKRFLQETKRVKVTLTGGECREDGSLGMWRFVKKRFQEPGQDVIRRKQKLR